MQGLEKDLVGHEIELFLVKCSDGAVELGRDHTRSRARLVAEERAAI